MVAITVILAAVIGAFVLGLGDDLGNGAGPQAQLNFDYDDSANGDNGELVVTHQGGDTVENAELKGAVNTDNFDATNDDPTDFTLSSGESATFTGTAADSFSDTGTVNVVVDDTVVASYEIEA